MNQTLLKLISLFLSKVEEAEDIMKASFKISEPMCFLSAGIDRVGKIGVYTYAFHGIGCKFGFGDFNIDYDYSEDGQTNGFDLWRLSQFGMQFEELHEFVSSGQIDQEFDLAAGANEIIKFDQGSLYHLANT